MSYRLTTPTKTHQVLFTFSEKLGTSEARLDKMGIVAAVQVHLSLPPLVKAVLEYYDFPLSNLLKHHDFKTDFVNPKLRAITLSNPMHHFSPGVSLYPTQFLIYGNGARLGYVDFITGKEVEFPAMSLPSRITHCAVHCDHVFTTEYIENAFYVTISSMSSGKWAFCSSKSLSGATPFGSPSLFAAFDNLREEWITASEKGNLVVLHSLSANRTTFQQVTRIATQRTDIIFAKCVKNEKVVIVRKKSCEVWDLKTKKKEGDTQQLDVEFQKALVMDHDETLVVTTHSKHLYFFQLPSCTLVSAIPVGFTPGCLASLYPDHLWFVGGDNELWAFGNHHWPTEAIHILNSFPPKIYTNGTHFIATIADRRNGDALVELR